MSPTDRSWSPGAELLGVIGNELDDLAANAATTPHRLRLVNVRQLLGWVVSRSTRAERASRLEDRLGTLVAEAGVRNRLAGGGNGSAALDAVVGLVEASASGDGSAEATLADLVGCLLELDGVIGGSSRAPDHGPAERPHTADDIAAYLRHRFGEAGTVVDDMSYVHGGFAKHTILVSCSIKGEQTHIVLRQVPRGRPRATLAPEFEVLCFSHEAGLPVPEPLWCEPDDNMLGEPFFATRRSSGSNIGDVWGAAVPPPRSLVLELAEVLARLHALDVSTLEAAPVRPMSRAAEIEAAIVEQEERAAGAGGADDPVLQGLFAWLRAHIPSPPARPMLVHGDVAFSNLLVADGRLTTLLDWERSHVGDGAEDLAYLRPSVEPILAWDEFLDAYAAAGGQRPDPDVERFYTVWKDVWRHVSCLTMAVHFRQTHRYASAVAGFVHGPRFRAAAARTAFSPNVPSVS